MTKVTRLPQIIRACIVKLEAYAPGPLCPNVSTSALPGYGPVAAGQKNRHGILNPARSTASRS